VNIGEPGPGLVAFGSLIAVQDAVNNAAPGSYDTPAGGRLDHRGHFAALQRVEEGTRGSGGHGLRWATGQSHIGSHPVSKRSCGPSLTGLIGPNGIPAVGATAHCCALCKMHPPSLAR